ncbi:BMA-TLN-1, isoform b [Aphelenchoides besseyi]|nr:BMA-TLN-1, isoform b [Aphelenchoides besseyi]KAI6208814.1 BMA-TLN-1, isoform b [Aphelenchoides besseyi]
MGVLTLNIENEELGVKKTMKFEPSTMVFDACRLIHDKLGMHGNSNDFGLIRVDEQPSKSFWMESNRKLEYYLIRSGDTLEYKNKVRQLRVRTLDGGAVKTIFVDESQPISQLMITVCTKMGIANHEEYSLVRDHPPTGTQRSQPQNGNENGYQQSNAFMNTIGRKKEKQIQQLRAKLHTDEEIQWVDQSKTLREQQIDENEELTLRRKFFFSDTNVDTRDPVQLNLLYLQCRDGVLSGVHPVSRDTAIKLAALQCYIEYGPFQEGVQKQLNVRELLPKEYAKAKEHEKNIAEEYREILYEDQMAPKKKYCELCQSLPTYGVTFFLVKEKLPEKNRLIPRLLGVNKESVMRVDEKTKQVLKEWPLEQVRRWAAAPKTFTLDFGDYKDGYYSVQTQDSEKIAQLIAGYIDIILKKKKLADHLGIEGDEGSTMLEDIVAPARATLIGTGQINQPQHAQDGHVALPGVLRSTSGTPSGIPHGAQYGAVSGIVTTQEMPKGERIRYQNPRERAQRALIGTIEQTIRAVEEAEEEILKPPQIDLPHFDTANRRWRVEVEKEAVSDRLAAMGAATAEVVQLTAIPDDSDSRVGVAIATIGSNLPEMGRGVRELAGLMPDEHRRGDLIEATRRLMGAFGNFIDKVHPEHVEKRSNILNAASHVGETTHDVIKTMRDETSEDRQFHDQLIKRAKDVATNTASLVMKAKIISSDCTEPALREQVIHSATQTAFATSELVACARVVAPTIDHPPSQERLTDAAQNVVRTVETLLQESNTATQYSATGNGQQNLGDIHAAARLVTNSLHNLIDHIKTSPRSQFHRKTQEEYNYEEILRSSNRANTQHDFAKDSNNAVHHSQILVQKYETDGDPNQRDKLHNAARVVAQATSNMINATQETQSRPQNTQAQTKLKTTAEELVQVTTDATNDRFASQTFQRVEQAAPSPSEQFKAACINAANTVSGIIGDLDTTILFATSGSLNQLSPRARGPADAGEHRNAITKTAQALMEDTKALVTGAASNQEQLAVAAQNATRTILQLSNAVRQAAPMLSNDSPESQGLVLHAVRDVASALSNLIQATKNASGRNPQDPAMNNLKDSAKSMVGNLKNLLQTVQSMQQKGQNGTYALEFAIHAIDFAVKQYDNNELRVDKQATAEEVVRATRAVVEASRRATEANLNDQESVIASANFAREAVAGLLHSALSAASNAESTELKFRTIHAGREVAIQVKELLARLVYLSNRPGNHDAQQSILLASHELKKAVSSLAQCCDTLRTSSWPEGMPVQDPEAEAENELLGAATSIEAAADKLKQMKPRHVQHHPEQEVEFDVRILEDAKSLVGAVSTLVQAATSSQRELVALGRVDGTSNQYHRNNDYQWSEGLISAARAVAVAVQQVCEAANGVVQGHASEEKLISASKQVASNTAQLIIACRVRSDTNSHNTERLKIAGHAVCTATKRLINEITTKESVDDQRVLVISDRMVCGMKQVMNAQEEVLRKERELQSAREKLAQINKSRYEKSPEPTD